MSIKNSFITWRPIYNNSNPCLKKNTNAASLTVSLFNDFFFNFSRSFSVDYCYECEWLIRKNVEEGAESVACFKLLSDYFPIACGNYQKDSLTPKQSKDSNHGLPQYEAGVPSTALWDANIPNTAIKRNVSLCDSIAYFVSLFPSSFLAFFFSFFLSFPLIFFCFHFFPFFLSLFHQNSKYL